MEEPQHQPSINYSYDTLLPLSLSVDYDRPGLSDSLPPLTLTLTPTPTGSLSTDSDPSVPYAVFRNQINDVAGESMEVPTTEFFSLDVVAAPSVPDVANSPSLAEPECSEKAWFNVGRQFRSPMLQLHKEILDFCDFVAPTPEEEESRTAAVKRVSDVIKHIWSDCKVEMFGSFRTGLYLPNSDVDIVILESKVRSPQLGLKALAKALTQQKVATKMQVIAKARVPIVKFVERTSKIAFDISFDLDGGPKAADFIKDAVRKLPPLRPLSLILKVFLQQRELNEVFSGGIGSYALLSMLIAYLQIHWRTQDSQAHWQQKEQNLGILLVSFFDFYGRKLNHADVGVSCNSSNNFYSKSDKGHPIMILLRTLIITIR
ncbi:nucleotidyltransferase family protein isoform X2 [Carex rostrata]